MNVQVYVDFTKKQEKELNDFPIAYAFSKEQLVGALEKIGAKDISECVSVMGHGDIVKKTDAPALKEMFRRHTKELHEALKDEEFAEAAFLYEMDNHEYAINWDGDAEVLGCFGLDFEDLEEMNLRDAYRRARNAHMKHAMEWGVI